jgi:hypothetical protein
LAKIGYIAADAGPKATLESVAQRLPGHWLKDVWHSPRQLQETLRAERIGLLFCGTSDTAAGRGFEARARIAANALALPCVVIEDFPGNYVDVPGGPPRVLFVESEFAARLARAKSGEELPVEICPAVRYDGLRRTLAGLRRAKSDAQNAVLWIGQPETADSLETLRRLLPAIVARGAALWFRAHPRDEGYARGAYRALLEAAEDLTSSPLSEVLARRPALVATQFSSVAIEAGFWGICALNVLFTDLGGRTLAAKKGYAVPPWCEQGAAFLILQERDVDKVLDRALGSRDARAQVLQCFDLYFNVHEEGCQSLINVLYNHGFL